MRFQAFLVPGLIAAAAIQLLVVLLPVIPLGIPGEWEWSRHDFPDSPVAAVIQLLPAVVGVTVLIFIARLGNRRFFRQHRRCIRDLPAQRQGPPAMITAILLIGLIAASWIWLKTAESCTPAQHRHIKSLWVLYDQSSSGYFFEAVFRIDSTSEFLSSYEDRMAEGDVLHVGTHPPGLFVLCRWSIQLCRMVPAFANQLYGWIPRNDLNTFRTLEASAAREQPMAKSDVTALFLVSEMTTLAAAFSVVPLFFLIRRCFDAFTGWRAACLWATVPCLVIFMPKSDVLFTLTSTTATAMGVIAIASRDGLVLRLLLAAGCGLVLWCGLMMSLAHLPVLALLGAVGLIRILRLKTQPDVMNAASTDVTRLMMVLATIGVGLVFATGVFSVACDCNMFSVWRMNLSNHAGFYDQHVRTAWKWLLVNPLELAMSVGLPLAVMALSGLVVAIGHFRQRTLSDLGSLHIDLSIAAAMTIGALWLSCRNSGEAARLWCFMTPWVLLLSAHWLRSEVRDRGMMNLSPIWHALLLTQMLVCIITSGRVSGFSF